MEMKNSSSKVYRKICIVCGIEFETDNKQKMVCSFACKADLNRIRARERNRKIRASEELPEFVEGLTKDCEWCGKEFVATKRSQRFCSPDCRRQNRNSNRNKKPQNQPKTIQVIREDQQRFELKCIVCGKTFFSASKQTRLCSAECRTLRKREREKIRNRQRRSQSQTQTVKEKQPEIEVKIGSGPYKMKDVHPSKCFEIEAEMRKQGKSYMDYQIEKTLKMIGKINVGNRN